MEFAQACKGLGVRPITGAELTVAGRPRHGSAHLTLLVETAAGYRNLCRLLTAAHSHTRDGTQRSADAAVGGAGAGRGARRGARLPLGLRPRRRAGRAPGSGAKRAAGAALARRLLAAFGRDRLRVELQRPYWRHDRARNRWLAGLAERLGVPCVATGNVHSHAPLAAPASRTPSSRSAWGRRWRTPSRGAAATRARCWPRRRRWPPASPSTRRRSPRPCASPSGCAST